MKESYNRNRFREKIRKKVKDNLRRYIAQPELINGKNVSVPYIDIPRFKYDPGALGGVGQGEGDLGEGVDPEESSPQRKLIETAVTLEDVAEMLAEEIGLPYSKPKPGDTLDSQKYTYKGITSKGRIKVFSRSFKQALRRGVISGSYDYDNPIVVPAGDDWRYRYPKPKPEPQTKAAIILMMDISNSMGEEQRELCRTQHKWTETLLKGRYPALEVRYIAHASTAEETDEHNFYHFYQGGGTVISSAYVLCDKIIEKDYPKQEWDVYPFHFTDGENSEYDNDRALGWLRYRLLPKSTMFCYGQCLSEIETGETKFLDMILDEFSLRDGLFVMPTLRLARINNIRDHIPVLRTFLNQKARPMYNVKDE